MELSNNNVSLRALEPEDLDLLYRIENEATLWHCSANNVPYSRYALRQYLTNAQNDIYKDEQVRLVIETSGEAIGLVDLFRFDAIHQRAEIGLLILPSFQGRGYGQAALQLLEGYARHLRLRQIYAIVAETNTATMKFFTASDFSDVAQLPSWFCLDGEFVTAHLWRKEL